MPSIHQINHPGQELRIRYSSRKRNIENYYFFEDSQTKGVRLWNRSSINGKRNSHKRKFIQINGKYIDKLDQRNERESILRFWGEYEGHSRFELLNSDNNAPYWNAPSAVHFPFFCNPLTIDQDQNTDPFIFGSDFFYTICKKNILKNLSIGDIILFGSEFGKKGDVHFYLDTVILIKDSYPSVLNNEKFPLVYRESTLKQIGITSCNKGYFPVHTCVKFCQNQEMFSFFPCRPVNDFQLAFGRPILNTEKLGLQKPGARTGYKTRILNEQDIVELWNYIANEVLMQGYCLGTHADDLPILKMMPEKE